MSGGVEHLLVRGSLAEIGGALRSGDISAVELALASLDRLGRLGPRYNAVAALTADRALAEARAADGELRQGHDRGPLHGIPYGAKDLIAARGAPTTWGAEPFRDQVFDEDATVLRRLRRGGAVLVGKMAMVALAGGGNYRYPSASLQGPGKTPWNTEHWSGGSSSGSGAAVAARLVPYALGSETSGSIVTPCSFCGITGVRPTYGLVSRHGAMALSWTLDKIGPMAGSAEDCGRVLEAIAGRDPRDPSTVRRGYRGPARLDRREVRVGYAPADFTETAAAHTRPAFAAAVDVVRELGVGLVEEALPPDLPSVAVVSTIIAADGATAFADLIEDGRIDQLSDERQKAGLRAGLDVTARDYLEAMRLRTRIQQTFRDLFSRVDVLIAPGRVSTSSRLDESLDAARSAPPPNRPSNTGLVAAGNVAGLPAIVLPCGFASDGLPVSLQVVGPPFSEPLLVALGMAFQSATDWHRQRPPGID